MERDAWNPGLLQTLTSPDGHQVKVTPVKWKKNAAELFRISNTYLMLMWNGFFPTTLMIAHKFTIGGLCIMEGQVGCLPHLQ
jgi:hypothetical protein